MPRYVVLERWTDQGVRAFSESHVRADASADLMSRFGVRIEPYWTMGEYDLVSLVEAPDDETVSAVLLADAMKGNVRTTTLRAFDRSEMERLVARLDSV